jgi:hypothetical protein
MVNIPGLGSGIGRIASQPINPDPTQRPGGFDEGGLVQQAIEALLQRDTDTAGDIIAQGQQMNPRFGEIVQRAVENLQEEEELAGQQGFDPTAMPGLGEDPFVGGAPMFQEASMLQGTQGQAPALEHATPPGGGIGDDISLTTTRLARMQAEITRRQRELANKGQEFGDDKLFKMEKQFRDELNEESDRLGVDRDELGRMIQNKIVDLQEERSTQLGAERTGLSLEKQKKMEEAQRKAQAEAQTAADQKAQRDKNLAALRREFPYLSDEELESLSNEVNQGQGIGVDETINDVLPNLPGDTQDEQRSALERFKKNMLDTIDREFREQEGVSSELMLLAVLQTIGSFFGGRKRLDVGSLRSVVPTNGNWRGLRLVSAHWRRVDTRKHSRCCLR